MLDELIKLSKISAQDREEYIFYTSQAGFLWLERKRRLLFMEEPPYPTVGENAASFLEGRRSLIRDAYKHIEWINNLIEEYQNDNRPKDGRPE